jgi:DNA invertase Pin-like site-specific DNA recombinase
MKVLYIRVSSSIEGKHGQKTDRQKINEREYDLVITDRVSGSLPFNERKGGQEVFKLINQGKLTSLYVHQIDRLGRNLLDILKTIQFFNEKGIPIHFISQGLRTIDDNGKENPISKMIISILGVVSEMERNLLRERQFEGIRIAKKNGVYQGRRKGTKEDTLKFLSKTRNKKALDLLKRGYKNIEVSRICQVHPNTITKIKKLGIGNLD